MTTAIRRDFVRTPAGLVEQAAAFQAAILADVAGRRGTMHGRIAPLSPQMKVSGPALTVEVRPGDNLMIHAAMTIAKPGDVLVIDGKADQTCALMGALMINACIKRGIAGVVIDAATRDRLELLDLGYPVFCVGTNPNGPMKQTSGRIGHPVSCGGIHVESGDLVVADADGVVVIERESVSQLLPLASQKLLDEAQWMLAIQSGNTSAPWLEKALRAAGLHDAELGL